MEKADMHIHTTESDGLLTPSEVVNWANKKKIKVISITDHDTINGISIAKKESKLIDNLIVIPGIEFSCHIGNEEIHILGYFIDYNSENLKKVCKKIKGSRFDRSKKIIKKLQHMGINISVEDVKKEIKSDYIGRPHIARVLKKKGYINTVEEAFDKYIGNTAPAYVRRYKLTIEEAVGLIKDAGGISVLAHPGLINNNYIDISKIFEQYDIDGIEVYHSKHNKSDITRFNYIANKLNLLVTGGSDCHGNINQNGPMIGDYYINYSELKNKLKTFKRKIKYE